MHDAIFKNLSSDFFSNTDTLGLTTGSDRSSCLLVLLVVVVLVSPLAEVVVLGRQDVSVVIVVVVDEAVESTLILLCGTGGAGTDGRARQLFTRLLMFCEWFMLGSSSISSLAMSKLESYCSCLLSASSSSKGFVVCAFVGVGAEGLSNDCFPMINKII